MDEEYMPDLVSVIDEEGKEHIFEELDRIETDDAQYVALAPLPEDPSEEDEGEEESVEFIVLRVIQGKGEEVTLEPIEDEEEYDEIGQIFLDRLTADENEE